MTMTILIVDDELKARRNLGDWLSHRGYEVIDAATLQEARANIARGIADLVLLDVQLPDGYGLDLLDEFPMQPTSPLFILITAYGDIEMAVEAMKNGAHDFLQKPIILATLEKSIRRAEDIISMRRDLMNFRTIRSEDGEFLIGSQSMQTLIQQAQRIAQTGASVLITGEISTGKESLARVIHRLGPRAHKPFITVNCATMAGPAIEAELFGYEPGAFENAKHRERGLIENADKGVLFLDEIASLPLDLQAKILSVMEKWSFKRLGGVRPISIDVQFLAASSHDLEALIAQKKFLGELYYRLKVVDLHIPPLRARREDIPSMVNLFIRQYSLRTGMTISNITPRAVEALMVYHWPGNIRELRNTIERAMLFCDGSVLDLHHLPPECYQAGMVSSRADAKSEIAVPPEASSRPVHNPRSRFSILFIAADPTDASRLRIGEELREIQKHLQSARLRTRFKLEFPRLSLQTSDISQALLDVQPQIVHFAGHGMATGALGFENSLGQTHFVQPGALAALFEQFADHVNCVVLNACYAEIQARAIAQHIDYVIGMSQAVSDRAAIAFTTGFYQALGAGRTVEEAYKLGCVQIKLQDIPESLVPVLIKKEQIMQG